GGGVSGGRAEVGAMGGSRTAQGLFGGFGLGGGGLALAVVPQVERWLGWRAPYATAAVLALLALVVVALAPRDRPRALPARELGRRAGVLGDRRLYRIAGLYAASLGLSVAVGNWVVTLLDRNGGLDAGAAGAV